MYPVHRNAGSLGMCPPFYPSKNRLGSQCHISPNESARVQAGEMHCGNRRGFTASPRRTARRSSSHMASRRVGPYRSGGIVACRRPIRPRPPPGYRPCRERPEMFAPTQPLLAVKDSDRVRERSRQSGTLAGRCAEALVPADPASLSTGLCGDQPCGRAVTARLRRRPGPNQRL